MWLTTRRVYNCARDDGVGTYRRYIIFNQLAYRWKNIERTYVEFDPGRGVHNAKTTF